MKTLGKIFIALMITGLILGGIMCWSCVEWAKDPHAVIEQTIKDIHGE